MNIRVILYLSLILQTFIVQSQEFNWATNVSGKSFELGVKAISDDSGNTYITGYTTDNLFEYAGVNYATNGDGGDAFFAKFDSGKNLVWMKSIGGNDNIYYDEILDIHIDPFGDIYLTFKSCSNKFIYDGQVLRGINSPGQYGGEAVLLKINSNGDYLWHDSGNISSSFRAITTDTNGNLYLTGYFTSTITLGGTTTLTNPSPWTTKDLLIAKYQPNGNIVWAKNAGGMPHNTFAYGYDIEINPQSNEVIVLGKGDGEVYFDGVPMPVKENSDQGNIIVSYTMGGTLNWVKRVLDYNNGYSYIESLAISPSGIIGVCGSTSRSSSGLVGFYNSDGSIISEHNYPSSGRLRLHSIDFNEFNGVYLSGWCERGATIGVSPETVSISSTTGFILKMNTLHQVKWITEFEASNFRNQISYNDNKISYAGRIDNNFIYNSGKDIITNNSGDALFGEITDKSLNTKKYSTKDFSVYPNPTSGHITIKTKTLQQVEIYNITGALIDITNKSEIDLSPYSKGIYLIKIITNQGIALKKIILI